MVRSMLFGLVVLALSGGPQDGAAAEAKGVRKDVPPAAETNWEARIESALEKKVKISLHETPLREFVSWLGETTGQLCLLNRRSLEDIGVAEDAPLTAEFPPISVRSALNLVLRDLGLTWTLRDGALVITSPEDEESRLQIEVFDVTDLVRPIPSDKPESSDPVDMIDLITSTVAPQSWDTVGGPGSIEAYRGGLVVSQTRDVREQIRELLSQYREAKQLAEEHTATAPPVPLVGGAAKRPAEAAIQLALDRDLPLEFDKTPLKDVAAHLQEACQIPVVLDVKALDEIGIDRAQPVTFRAARIQLRQGLSHILRELGLTYLVRDEALVITVPEEAEKKLVTAAYPVADLLGETAGCDEFGERQRPVGLDELTDLITTTVQPQSWDRVGGLGSIDGCDYIDVLVISNTPDALAEVTGMLMQLRQHLAQRRTAGLTKTDQPAGEATQVVVYLFAVPEAARQPSASAGEKAGGTQQPSGSGGFFALPLEQMGGGGPVWRGGAEGVRTVAISEKELASLIVQLVEPKSWETKREDVYVKPVPGRLIVRQTERVHGKIERFLSKLGVVYQKR